MNTYNEELDKVKLVVALRTARAITGWSQVEFAKRVGLSKSHVCRLETKETEISASDLNKITREYKKMGIEIDVLGSDNLNVTVKPLAFKSFMARLEDDNHRRSDRKKRA